MLVGPSIETFYVLEIANFRPQLSVQVSPFHSIFSALIHTNIFSCQCHWLYLPTFCVLNEISVAKSGFG